MDNKFNIGKRIKLIRTQQRISQEKLTELVGYKNRSMITRIEQGLIDLPESKIVAIANALGVTPSYIMGWNTENKKESLEETIEKLNPKLKQDLRRKQSVVEALFFDGDEPTDEEDKEILKNTIAKEYIRLLKSKGKL